MKKHLFCAARGHEDRWEAICFDLDIALEGKSFEDVQDRLNKAIVAYINTALEKDEATRNRLLNRRAPLWVRIQWTLPIFIASIFSRDRNGDDAPLPFYAPCPA